ncbi:MAG: sensor domain-containing diguanylate cyclase, partial [Deltaproteobacteria bacterium]|nr:sensor domain-containing diguanylate cyclase [Deltaproteobacteria bacterium]
SGLSLNHVDGQALAGQSWVGVPIQVYEQTIGVLVAWSREPESFTDADLGLVKMVGLQAAVALQNSRLYVLATVDGLTRLFVRRYFDRRLAEEVARARRYKSHFTLMLLDFDDFKAVNDRYGHAVGDLVLRRAADILLTEVRSMDIPCRYGGDEFSVILPEVDAAGATVLAQRILRRVAGERIPAGDESLSFGMSVGLASFPDHTREDAATLIARADEALYHIKHTGKGKMAIYGEWDDGPIPRD